MAICPLAATMYVGCGLDDAPQQGASPVPYLTLRGLYEHCRVPVADWVDASSASVVRFFNPAAEYLRASRVVEEPPPPSQADFEQWALMDTESW